MKTCEIDKDDLKLIIEFIKESNTLLKDNGYNPKRKNIQLLNRLKNKLELLNDGQALL